MLPGFIDCHVHLCLDSSADIAKSLSFPNEMIALKGSQFASRTLQAGITSVRDMGGKNYIDLIIRDAINNGIVEGPRMLASGRMLTMTGGQGWNFGACECDGPLEVIKAVRRQVKAGADIGKFMATGGVLTPGVEPDNIMLTKEELEAGISTAHGAGKKTAAHAEGTDGILNSLLAGVDTIEHGIGLNDETISLMKKKNVFLLPTLAAITNVENKGLALEIPDYALKKAGRIKKIHMESIKMAIEAGVKIAMGTDSGCPCNYHGDNLFELELLVKAGYSTIEALCAGTKVGAQVMGWEKDLGTVEEGKIADLVVIKGNPIDDISILRNPDSILFVMKGGQLYKKNEDM